MEETVFFTADGLRLHGTLHMPEKKNPPVVIGLHGMLSNGDSPKQLALGEKCADMGIAYFRFDHRGCGKSDGRFAEVTTFAGRCRDLAAAADMISCRPDTCGVRGLFGSSLGGAVVLSAAGDLNPNLSAVVTLAAPVSFSSIKVPVSYETDPELSKIKKKQMDFDISDRLSLVHSILICHGSADTVVPFENALKIYESAREPKKLLRLEDSDHPVSSTEHQQSFMENTLDWFERVK